MEETDLYSKSHNIASQITTTPTKLYSHFIYKATIVGIFLVVVPLLPSQPLDFINQALHTGRWEILQLLFVGIAISYGIFSKRSEEGETEPHATKLDNAQSYVSRLFQASSVFDDETENLSEPDDSKAQMWNSQYYKGEPMVFVAHESSVLDQEHSGNKIVEKPLIMPVRSLKSRVPEDLDGFPLYYMPYSMEDSEFNLLESRSFRSQSFNSSRTSSASPSPSPYLSPEKVVMETEDDSVSEYNEDYGFEAVANKEEMGLKNGCDMGPDVDKKADEFIAKFKEQIRLQKIAGHIL